MVLFTIKKGNFVCLNCLIHLFHSIFLIQCLFLFKMEDNLHLGSLIFFLYFFVFKLFTFIINLILFKNAILNYIAQLLFHSHSKSKKLKIDRKFDTFRWIWFGEFVVRQLIQSCVCVCVFLLISICTDNKFTILVNLQQFKFLIKFLIKQKNQKLIKSEKENVKQLIKYHIYLSISLSFLLIKYSFIVSLF